MSLKGTNNTSSDGARILSIPERLDKALKDGIISPSQYNKLMADYRAKTRIERPQKKNWFKGIISLLRNVISIPIGLILYAVMETLTASLYSLLLKIPVLSLLMTGFIPADIFFSTMVVTTSAITAFFVVRFISDYKSTNYSILVVFLILLFKGIVSAVVYLAARGFNFVYLSSALIYIGTYLFGCFMAVEKE